MEWEVGIKQQVCGVKGCFWKEKVFTVTELPFHHRNSLEISFIFILFSSSLLFSNQCLPSLSLFLFTLLHEVKEWMLQENLTVWSLTSKSLPLSSRNLFPSFFLVTIRSPSLKRILRAVHFSCQTSFHSFRLILDLSLSHSTFHLCPSPHFLLMNFGGTFVCNNFKFSPRIKCPLLSLFLVTSHHELFGKSSKGKIPIDSKWHIVCSFLFFSFRHFSLFRHLISLNSLSNTIRLWFPWLGNLNSREFSAENKFNCEFCPLFSFFQLVIWFSGKKENMLRICLVIFLDLLCHDSFHITGVFAQNVENILLLTLNLFQTSSSIVKMKTVA